jgi:hypothetical protein
MEISALRGRAQTWLLLALLALCGHWICQLKTMTKRPTGISSIRSGSLYPYMRAARIFIRAPQ